MGTQIDGFKTRIESVESGLTSLQATTEVLQAKVNAIIKNVQSVVFVPQYTDYDVLTTYLNRYKWVDKKLVQDENLYPTTTIKFRVQPAGAAADLVSLWQETPTCLKLESSEALKNAATRAATQYMEIKNVVSEGDFLLVDAINKNTANETVPTTLVITNNITVVEDDDATEENESEKIVLAKTSDYFNVNSQDLATYGKLLSGENVDHVTFKEGKVVVMTENYGKASVDIHNTYFDAYPYSKLNGELVATEGKQPFNSPASNLVYLDVTGDKDYFTVNANGVAVKALDGNANPDAVGKQVVVTLADATYGYNASGNYMVQYQVTYTAVKDICKVAYSVGTYDIVWPNTTAASTYITVETIKTESAKLAQYKLTAEDVFNRLYDAISGVEEGMETSATNGTIITYVAKVDEKGNKYITATPTVNKLAANYWDKTDTHEATFILGDNKEIDLTLNATVHLDIPAAEEFLAKEIQYWDGEDNNDVRVNYNVVDLQTKTPYVYGFNMYKTYTNAETWAKEGVVYTWSIDPYEYNDVEYTVAEENGGIEMDVTEDGNLVVNGPITLVAGEDTIYRTANDLNFTLTVTYGATQLAQATKQGFHITYPTEGATFATPPVNIGASKFLASAANVSEGVAYTDKDSHKWIVKGAFDEEYQITWGYKNLTYQVVDAVVAGTSVKPANDVIPSFENPSEGELTITNAHNLTKNLEITVRVSFDYNYELRISQEYKVMVLANE